MKCADTEAIETYLALRDDLRTERSQEEVYWHRSN
jgi:hypothetical protein